MNTYLEMHCWSEQIVYLYMYMWLQQIASYSILHFTYLCRVAIFNLYTLKLITLKVPALCLSYMHILSAYLEHSWWLSVYLFSSNKMDRKGLIKLVLYVVKLALSCLVILPVSQNQQLATYKILCYNEVLLTGDICMTEKWAIHWLHMIAYIIHITNTQCFNKKNLRCWSLSYHYKVAMNASWNQLVVHWLL